MKPVIQWAVKNAPAMNTLMIAVLVVGSLSMVNMRREMFPEFELEIILVRVPYPGASPADVEEGICQKVEESVRSIAGIKKQTSVAREGSGYLVLELELGVDPERLLNEVRSAVDRIPSFPRLAEKPEVQQITIRQPAIRVSVQGPQSTTPDAEMALRDVAEQVRDDLLQLKSVTQANLMGTKNYQIDIEVPEETLRKHGLTLQRVAQTVRRENIEMPGGTLRSETQEVLLRGKNKRVTGDEIGKIPVVTQSNGVVLTLADLGMVRDEFEDFSVINQVNDRPAVTIAIDRTATEDLIQICSAVKNYVKSYSAPPGYDIKVWYDTSLDVQGRLDLLKKNGLQGLVLLFLVLAVFLELRLAFWVALGIPIAIFGAAAILSLHGDTLNMLTMFSFLMALGIVVDDAIVIGENIYAHRQLGKPFAQAAIDGAHEVLPSVIASVSTTILAFAPMMFVTGVMGKFIAVMPVAVIAMLIISLGEAVTLLPCHLGHRENLFLRGVGYLLYPFKPISNGLSWMNRLSDAGLNKVVNQWYQPSLAWCLRNPATVVCGGIFLGLATAGMVRAGITQFVFFPKQDSKWIEASITYPDGTPFSETEAATAQLQEAFKRVVAKHPDTQIHQIINRAVGSVTGNGQLGQSTNSGSHLGSVFVELHDTLVRTVDSETLLAKWREEAGLFPGVEQLTFGSPGFGPGGVALEFKVLAPAEHMETLDLAVERCKEYLATQKGVVDIRDDSTPGKLEFRMRIKEGALAMGVTAADLAETVRASYYGEEVMRLQRGRHEVKLMVRYPREERASHEDLNNIRMRTDDGVERPLSELADIEIARGYSEINRIEQKRSITITSDILEGQANAREIESRFKAVFLPRLMEEEPFKGVISVLWEGQAQQRQESLGSLFSGFGIAIFAMFVLLTLNFRSYLQPLLILCIIPFGVIGAVWGHAVMGYNVTFFSMFGLVALTGVVVNDSIVLIDFINMRIRNGIPLNQALLEAGQRRFRPVILTSITTIAGLFPILLERSFQAQYLIPMAISLSFGLMLATFLVLYLVPVFYRMYGALVGLADESPASSPAKAKVPTTTSPAGGTEPFNPEVMPALNRDLGVEGS